MTTTVVSGGTGYVGRFIVERCLAAGHRVRLLGRRPPSNGLLSRPVDFRHHTLSTEPVDLSLFEGADAFIHAAFHHLPGRYRGGEGDQPELFQTFNHQGSLALFDAASEAGLRQAVFLSSRAVYGRQPSGAVLDEQSGPRPDTLYGAVKLATERALQRLARPDFQISILRVTGVYGPAGAGRSHKWSALFEAFMQGEAVASRIGTEVHGEDLAEAILLLLEQGGGASEPLLGRDVASLFNVSDILLDHRDLLLAFAEQTGRKGRLPARADPAAFNAMDGRRLKSRGWRPRGCLDLAGLVNAGL